EAARSEQITLPQGRQELLVQSTDPAGNGAEVRVPVVVDTLGPAMLGKVPSVFRSSALDLKITVADVHGAKLDAQIDGAPVDDADLYVTDPETPAVSDPSSEQGSASAKLPTRATYQLSAHEALYEGRHTIKLTSTDSLGTTRSVTRAFVVDSTESLDGAAGMKAGARGADVTALQSELLKQGAATRGGLGAELTSRQYGAATKRAVATLQTRKGVTADGVAGADTLAALTLRIVIDQSAHSLTLFRSGKVLKSYPVAVGQPKFPTPNGSFKIVNMQKDPTWTPPDSVWAKGAKPIGPGAENPLGTRWMGIGGSVGIHGTNSPSSIGFSVSHGCIRMQISDVEDLYDRVRVGTPVIVQA
ncbi:MAG: L,D-transpeptidase family protein, partial [Thermoleophilia bacterium]|nr:L,D-transpeptidase family protein [Thermoleophilia bacterium]